MKRYTFFLLWSLCLLAYANSLAINPVKPTKDKGGDKPVASKLVSSKPIDKKRPKVEEIKPLLPKTTWVNLPTSFNTPTSIKEDKKSVGPDLFMFTATASKDSIAVGEEFELTVRVDWVDFGNGSAITFLPFWHKYVLKVVMPEGFIQTGGNYEDFCSEPVNAENPRATFTIKGKFEHVPEKPVFTILRGFEGSDEKSEFILKGEKGVRVNSVNKQDNRNARLNGLWIPKENILMSAIVLNKTEYCDEDEEIILTFNLTNNSSTDLKNARIYFHYESSKGCYSDKKELMKYIDAKIAKEKSCSDEINIEKTKTVSVSIKSTLKILRFIAGKATYNNFHAMNDIDMVDDNGNYSCVFGNVSIPNFTDLSKAPVATVNGNTLSATGCLSGSIITWNNNGGTGSDVVVSPVVTTKYKATCKKNNCVSSASNEVTVIVPIIPPTLKSTTKSICSGNAIDLMTEGTCNIGSLNWYQKYKVLSFSIYVPIEQTTLIPTIDATYYARCETSYDNSDYVQFDVTVKAKPSTPSKPTTSVLKLYYGESTTLSTTGCTGGTITWDNSSSTGSSVTIAPTQTTTYKAKCTTTNGCSSDYSEGVTVTVYAKSPTIKITGGNPITKNGIDYYCKGDIVTLEATCPSGYTPSWTESGNIYTSPHVFTVNNLKTYLAKCSINGISSEEVPYKCDISQVKKPTNTSVSPTTITAGQSTLITFGGTCEIGSLVWNKSDNQGWASSPSVSVNTATAFNFACENEQECVSENGDPRSVSIYGGVTVSATSTKTSSCDANDGKITATASGGTGSGYQYKLFRNDGTTVLTEYSSSSSFNNLPAGVYYIKAKDSNQAESAPQAVTVEAPSGPSIPQNVVANPSTIKKGESSTLTASCSTGTVTWYDDKYDEITNTTVSPNATTAYKVACVDGTCKSNYATVTITVTGTVKPSDPTNVTSNTSICAGTAIQLSANCSSDATVVWYSNSGLSNVLSNTNVTPTSSSNYYVVCQKEGVSSNPKSVEITVNAASAPTISPSLAEVTSVSPTVQLTSSGCAGGEIRWFNSAGNLVGTGTTYTASTGSYLAKCVLTCGNGSTSVATSETKQVTYREICTTAGISPILVNDTKPNGYPTTRIYISGSINLHVEGCKDNNRAKWYNAQGAYLGQSATYSATISSNATFAVACEDHCEPSKTVGFTSINFVVDNNVDPQLINETAGGKSEFCGVGQLTVRASGCPDPNKVRWWVGNLTEIGASYTAIITTTTEARFQCIHPVTGQLIGNQKYMTFNVKTYTQCNYAASIINNTPGEKRAFCKKGWIDLAVSGCPNNNLVVWYTEGTELTGGISPVLRGTITRTSRIGVNCINPNDNSQFGWNEITFVVDNSGCNSPTPTIINNTTNQSNKFCQKGWVNLEVDGCTDNSKAKWYKNDVLKSITAIYREVINTTANYKVICDGATLTNPYYAEITMEVMTHSTCDLPSAINLTPNNQTDFCGSGNLKLMMTGCNTQQRGVAYEGHYDDGTLTGNAGGMINGSWEMIDGIYQNILNYNVVKSGYFKVYCKDDNNNIRYNTEQRVYFKVNPIPSVTASNIPACVNSRFMLAAQIPSNPNNTGNISFGWKNTATGAAVGTLQNTSLTATDITPTDYTVTFTDNKGCVASDHTTVTNLANPIISVPISLVEACQDKPITFTSSTSGAGVVKTITVNVPSRETEPSSTNTLPRSGIILVTNGSGEVLSSINVLQKGITYSTTCVKCGNISLTDGMIVGYRNGDKPAKIKVINGCAKLVWPDLNDDLVYSDWVSQMTGKTLSDATILSCLTLGNVNNCSANTQSCVVVENTSSPSNIAATGGTGTFTFSTPTTGGTWTIAAPSWVTLSETSGGVDNIYQWTKGTSQTNLSSRATLTLANVTPTDAGIYTVQITDAKNCKASTNVSLTIRNKPTISLLSNSPENGSTQIGVGEDLIVSVLENYPSYKWLFDSDPTILGTTQELTRINASKDYSGTYKVSVEDQYGCPNSNTIQVAIKPFECKLMAIATPTCYIQNNKRWAKVDITVKNRTLHWSGISTIQRVKDLDGNEVQDPILYTNTWQNANTTQIALPTQDKILDGIYKISIAEKRSDQESGEGVECYPEDIFITVGCQRQCKKLQPCLTGDCCGIPANIDLNQEIKLETLTVNDVVKANDFDLIITKVSVANAANYSWNIEAISKVPVFDNVFIGLKSTTPVVFNECKELVSGQIETLYNPANWDKPIQGKAIAKALYESAKEVLQALTTNPDVNVDMTQQDLANVAEQLREQAAKDLPKDLELKANEAIRKMEEARDEYAKAKAAGDSAGMAAATTKFNDAKAELATVKTETEKYLNLYQRIVQLTLDRMWTRFGSIPTPPVPAVESTEEQAIGESIPISQMTWLSEAEKTAIINNFKTKAEDNLKLTFKFFVERHTNNATAIKDLEKKVLVYDKDGASTIEVVSPTQKLSEYIYATMCKTCTGTAPDPMEAKMVNTTERAFSKRIKEIFKNLYTKE